MQFWCFIFFTLFTLKFNHDVDLSFLHCRHVDFVLAFVRIPLISAKTYCERESFISGVMTQTKTFMMMMADEAESQIIQ